MKNSHAPLLGEGAQGPAWSLGGRAPGVLGSTEPCPPLPCGYTEVQGEDPGLGHMVRGRSTPTRLVRAGDPLQ